MARHVQVWRLFAFLFAVWVCSVKAALPRPVFKVLAASLYDGGLQHGRLAKEQIQKWSQTEFMQQIKTFASGPGKAAFAALKASNTAAFPQYAKELRGIAQGAELDEDWVWIMNLLSELGELMQPTGPLYEPEGHCSAIYAVHPNGYASGFSLGHNEDWSVELKPLWYWLFQTYPDGSECSGMVYPGVLVGWAGTWNNHGLFLTQNSLYPAKSRSSGLGSSFVQRAAFCNSTSLDEVVAKLSTKGWAEAASVNLLDLKHRKMANLELCEDSIGGPVYVSRNYSHFNVFKELSGIIPEEQGSIRKSSLHRQARADALSPPASWQDVVKVLGDVTDNAYPIYRDITLATLVMDGLTGQLRTWEDANPATTEPSHVWSLLK